MNSVGLSSKRIANVINNFQNPTLEQVEISSAIEKLSKDLGKANETKVQVAIGMPLYYNSDPETINDTFNKELQARIEGTLPASHIYQLGMHGKVLISLGIPSLLIEMNSDKLKIRASTDYTNDHPFDLANVRDLPKALQSPIAVFDSKTKVGHKVVVSDLKQDGYNFVVAIQINSHPRGYIEVILRSTTYEVFIQKTILVTLLAG